MGVQSHEVCAQHHFECARNHLYLTYISCLWCVTMWVAVPMSTTAGAVSESEGADGDVASYLVWGILASGAFGRLFPFSV